MIKQFYVTCGDEKCKQYKISYLIELNSSYVLIINDPQCLECSSLCTCTFDKPNRTEKVIKDNQGVIYFNELTEYRDKSKAIK
jgi:hypothetical protein